MPQQDPRPGEIYLHFKQKLYQVVTVARHSETGEELVVYQALYGSFQTYARPLAMFISPVDREKYPDVTQKYRFQLLERRAGQPGQTESAGTGEEVRTDRTALPPEKAMLYENAEKAENLRQKESSTPEAKMMAFFDAGSIEEKYKILITMSDCITDHMINNMAVVLDLVIEDGPVEQRFDELKRCLRTMQQYETTRLR